ncbi:MAG TPA: hypothetical protein ENJ63_03440 [Dissulfuribacter thermophilus]|uniref:Flagellar FliJ protein n=1 Tax=Dissulfuribacter thermophilus TaxID=1156395 RepID=A0A7V2SYF7_9BACT|nr:hypothetical protein [Dissulfuribacter thermophilus]
MAAFRFRLEPYRRMVNHDKERAQIEFSLKMAKVREAREILDSIRQEFYKATRELETRLEEGMGTVEYRIWAERIDFLRGEQNRLEAVLRERELEAEQAKHKLLEAYVQERLVERLRERAIAEHQKLEARKLQEELDDMCASRKGLTWGLEGEGTS